MERTTFLNNYRIRSQYDGTPYEPVSSGSTTTYDAVDERTAEPVSVTLIPAVSIDPSEREQFEENARAAQKLRHANIAKVFDFGRDGNDYVYVSERLAGETLASWVRSHGPMPADAALRVCEQIISVLSSAGFHKIAYPPIQASDVMLVPGQTAEGTWPLIKVTNFGLPQLRPAPAPEPQSIPSELPAEAATGKQAMNGQVQFGEPTTDIRSEMYSLGVTLYFLLTGVALSGETLQRGPKFAGFPKALRSLLGKLLHRDSDQRPKDLLVVTEMIRESLGKIERRRALADRYGIPLKTSVPRPGRGRPKLLLRTATVLGILLLFAAVLAPLVFPDAIGKLVRDFQKPKEIGVLVGVPDPSPAASKPPAFGQVPQHTSASAPAIVSSQAVNPAASPDTAASGNAAMTPNPFHVAPADVQQAQIANAQSQATAPTNSALDSAESPGDSSSKIDANASAQANTEPPQATPSESSSRSTEKSVASKSKRTRPRSSAGYSQQGRTRLMRSRVTGITADGRLILRLPSGRTAIVAPDEDTPVRRHRSRVYDDRDQMLGPPPGFGPQYYPGD